MRTISIAAAALTIGLVVGSIGLAVAAPSPAAAEARSGGLGLKLGWDFRDAGATLAEIVATLTGQDVDDVAEARADGKSFAEIAQAAGVSSETVVDGVLDAREGVLDERVAAGDLTGEQAALALERMESRLTERIDDPSACGGTPGDGGGYRGGRRAGACGGDCQSR